MGNIPNTPTETILNLLLARDNKMLAPGSDDIGKLSQRFQSHKTEIQNFLSNLQSHPDYIDKIIRTGSTPEGRASLMQKLSSDSDKKALGFILDNAATIQPMMHYLATHKEQSATTIKFMGDNANYFSETAKFVYDDHPSKNAKAKNVVEIQNLKKLADNNDGKIPGKFGLLLKADGDLISFLKSNQDRLGNFRDFIDKNKATFEDMTKGGADPVQVFKYASYIDANKDRLGSFLSSNAFAKSADGHGFGDLFADSRSNKPEQQTYAAIDSKIKGATFNDQLLGSYSQGVDATEVLKISGVMAKNKSQFIS